VINSQRLPRFFKLREYHQETPISAKVRGVPENARWAIKTGWKVAPAWLVVLALTTLAMGAIPAAQGLIGREMVNRVVAAINNPSQFRSDVLPWFLYGLYLTAVMEIIGAAKRYSISRMSEKLQWHISTEIFEHSSRLDLAVFEDPQKQDVIERARGRMDEHVKAFITSILDGLLAIIQVVGIIAILIVIDPLATVVFLPLSVPYIIFYWKRSVERYTQDREQAVRRRWSNYYSGLLLSRFNVPEIRFLNLAPILISRFHDFLEEFFENDRKIYTRTHFGGAVLSVVYAILFSGASIWIGYRVVSGQLSLGDLTLFVRAAAQLQSGLERSSSNFTTVIEKTLYISDLQEFLNLKPSLGTGGTSKMDQVQGQIEFDNVVFRYPGTQREVLKGISFSISPGEITALVGANGAGKSTIVNLLARLYDPTEGSIRLDSHPLSELDLDYLHSQIAFVLQNFNRYEATAWENIAFGAWQRAMEQPDIVEDIARRVGVQDLITAMPEGYETMLGRRFGVYDLSGGQWQRLVIARALLRNTGIVILDEPTSNLDVLAEYELFSNLRKLVQNRTTIVISHRFTTVRHADRILVLDDGEIIEQGTHEELMNRKGHYENLFRLSARRSEMSHGDAGAANG